MSNQADRLKTALSDRYALERELGSGGMATVYLAEDLKHHRQVAVKVLKPELAAVLGAERFLREIEIAAGLTHPHILPLHDSGEADGFLYYVMPYIKGESLRAKVARQKELPINEAVRMLRDVADALASAHRQGVVHRDIKPDNILVSENHALVTDFGVAKAVSEATGREQLTTVGVALGTPAYMAPEQAAADPNIDHRADVYALGAVAYELLTGRPPFMGDSPQVVLSAHVTEAPVPVTKHRATVPPALAELVMRCLEKKPADRWQSADELLHQLEALATPSGGTAPVTAVSAPVKQWWYRWGTAAAAVALLAVGAVWLLSPRGESSAAAISENRVAIFPFSVRGASPELTFLADGVAELLSTALDGAAGLRTVDPNAVFNVAQRDGQVPDRDRGKELAARLGAGVYVVGSVTDAGGERVQIRASLYYGDADQPVAGRVTGSEEQTLELVRELAQQLLVRYAAAGTSRLDSLTLFTTDSIEALKAYFAGMKHYRAGRWDSAINPFRQAVAIDTAFALAHYMLSRAASWANRQDVVQEALMTALRLRDRLSERHRLLVEAADAFERAAVEEVEDRTQRILRNYPDEFEAWYLLGETRIHFGPHRGRPFTEAREPLERAFALDPGRGDAFAHLLDLSLMERDVAVIDSLLRLRYPAPEDSIDYRIVHALASKDSLQWTEVSSALRELRHFDLVYWGSRIAWYWRDLKTGVEVTRLATEQSVPASWRALGHFNLAQFELTRGRWQATKTELGTLSLWDPAGALELRALFAAHGFPPVPEAEVRALRDTLARWDAAAGAACFDATYWLCTHYPVHVELRSYLLALSSWRLGDNDAALRYAEQLERREDSPDASALAADLARGVRARVARSQGNLAQALEYLEEPSAQQSAMVIASPLLSLASERLLRADVLSDLGRSQEALQWYESTDWPFLYPQALLRSGEIYEQLGDTEQAVEHYKRFVDIWADADSEFQPIARDVKQRIARLVGER